MAHVSLLTLGVDNLAASTTFYRALGWRVSPASVDGVVTFLTGGAVPLSLFPRPAFRTDTGIEPSTARDSSSVAMAMNVDSPADVDAWCARVVVAGGEVTQQPGPTEWGGYRGYVRDLDGHLWEIAHNPGFALHDDGTITIPE